MKLEHDAKSSNYTVGRILTYISLPIAAGEKIFFLTSKSPQTPLLLDLTW